jgi:hypothetical protein
MTPIPCWMEHTIYRVVVSVIGLLSMVGDIEYGEELCAIVLFDWTLVSLVGEMKDCSCDR